MANDHDQIDIFAELGVEPIRRERSQPAPQQPLTALDGTVLTPIPGYESLAAAEDGIAVRLVHTHSREKSKKVGFYAENVAGAMSGKWPSLWWVELHAGPGKLYEIETRRVLDG